MRIAMLGKAIVYCRALLAQCWAKPLYTAVPFWRAHASQPLPVPDPLPINPRHSTKLRTVPRSESKAGACHIYAVTTTLRVHPPLEPRPTTKSCQTRHSSTSENIIYQEVIPNSTGVTLAMSLATKSYFMSMSRMHCKSPCVCHGVTVFGPIRAATHQHVRACAL